LFDSSSKGDTVARIRTIKPEFFTSEDIVSLSPLARLLYIATWCEADKEGRLVWKPKTFKLRYFPGDTCDIDALCAELVERNLVKLYGDGLAYIPAFADHQHINPRESASTLPAPDASPRVRTRAARDSDAQGGREGKGREGEGREDACPHDAIIAAYHEALPMCPKVRSWTDKRRESLRARWREDAKRQSLDYWQRFFAHVAASPFLVGEGPSREDRAPFIASLDWLVLPENFAKVIEGRYHDRSAA
jgi:hypothetical protein